MEEKHSVQELKEYFRKRRRNSNTVFDLFLGNVSIVYALRMMAEEYWSGASKKSLFKFTEHRYLAKGNKGALPLEWEDAKDVLNLDKDSPPITLIVYIASSCINDVNHITNALRKILSRERELIPISMARQLDTHCMRWLMRQPGRDFVEKAGVNQRVLAVIRKENYNTLENRVFKDFLIKSQSLAQIYISNYKENYGNSEILKSVEYYTKICERALSIPEMECISGIYSLPNPNYVLLQNNYYSKIWRMYCRVMKLSSLIEKMWDRKEELGKTIQNLQADFKYYSSNYEVLRYHNQIWINDFDGINDFVESYDFKKDLLPSNDEILDKRRLFKERTPFVSDGIAVIDLSGHYIFGDELVVDCKSHSNAKPRVYDSLYSLPFDSNKKKHSVKEIFYDGFNDKNANAFFSYIVGEYKRRYGNVDKYIVIIPDDWDVYKQERIFHSISNIPRSSINLLWRSVAVALGYRDSILSQINSECSVAIVDYRIDGKRFVSELRYIRDNGKLIPQRSCYNSKNCSRHCYIDDNKSFLDTDIVKNSKVVCFSGIIPETLCTYFSSLYCETPIEHNGTLIYKQRDGKKIFIVNKKDCFCERDGALFFANRYKKETLYFDQLESMWIVGQRKEKIVSEYLVKGDDRFIGGSTAVINVPKGLISIQEGSRKVEFLFHIGANLENDTILHQYTEKLIITGNIKAVPVSCSVKVSPGQGLAITELKSGLFEKPLVLNYLEHMEVSDVTINSKENAIKRSYPPTVAIVEPYPPEYYSDGGNLSGALNCAKDFCQAILNNPNIELSNFRTCFYHARLKSKFIANINPYRSLDRYNIFGTSKGVHTRPFFVNEKEERELIECLATKYKNNEEGSLNLLAWMYPSKNKRIIEIVLDVVCGYSKNKGLNPLKISLLANSLYQKGFEELEVKVLKTFVERFRCGEANNNDYRLIYNLFQFDENIFSPKSKKWSSLNINPYEIIRCIQRDLKKYKENMPRPRSGCYKSMLYVLLFFLRIREYNVNFLRSEDWYTNHGYDISKLEIEIALYNSLTEELQEEKSGLHTGQFPKIILDYVEGEGTIDGLVKISDDLDKTNDKV